MTLFGFNSDSVCHSNRSRLSLPFHHHRLCSIFHHPSSLAPSFHAIIPVDSPVTNFIFPKSPKFSLAKALIDPTKPFLGQTFTQSQWKKIKTVKPNHNCQVRL
eukprot:TRINITY_DN27407_c0_g1_i1.p1 TRINITY_DN27407_c0_g1~~TRINITY_DN27407_c0_g1_i1.p1  ORF type:complete len:103 (+),score=2.06 TRINITY_DN27407_c0_g1_i1:593-901(+)